MRASVENIVVGSLETSPGSAVTGAMSVHDWMAARQRAGTNGEAPPVAEVLSSQPSAPSRVGEGVGVD